MSTSMTSRGNGPSDACPSKTGNEQGRKQARKKTILIQKKKKTKKKKTNKRSKNRIIIIVIVIISGCLSAMVRRQREARVKKGGKRQSSLCPSFPTASPPTSNTCEQREYQKHKKGECVLRRREQASLFFDADE